MAKWRTSASASYAAPRHGFPLSLISRDWKYIRHIQFTIQLFLTVSTFQPGWQSPGIGYRSVAADDALSPICEYIKVAVEVNGMDSMLTLPGETPREYLEYGQKMLTRVQIGGEGQMVGRTALDKLTGDFLESHGLQGESSERRKELIASVLGCYAQAPACHGPFALSEDYGRIDSADTIVADVQIGNKCFAGLKVPRGGNYTETALDFVVRQGWNSGAGCRDALCVANRIACSVHSAERQQREDLVKKSDLVTSDSGHRRKDENIDLAGTYTSLCEGQHCRIRRVCWTGSEWLMKLDELHEAPMKKWWQTNLLKHPGLGGAAIATYKYTGLVEAELRARRLETLFWDKPPIVESRTEIIFQTHIPHVAENIFPLLGGPDISNSPITVALPGVENGTTPWLDGIIKTLEAAGLVSRVLYSADFERPVCFMDAYFRAGSDCMGPDVARGKGCSNSWFRSPFNLSHVVSTLQSAVWTHAGLPPAYDDTAASGRKAHVESLPSECLFNITMIMRSCNRIFLDPELFRIVLEKQLAENALSACVRAFDFQGMSFADQVRIVAGSSVVIAAHGAALTNIAWMRPKTTVVEIFPHNFNYSTYFGSLASEVGVRYVHLIDPKPRSQCMVAWTLDWGQHLSKRHQTTPHSVAEDIDACMGNESCQRCAKDSEIALANFDVFEVIKEAIGSLRIRGG